MSYRLDPKVYVVCVAAKKAGLSHGCWVSADQDVSDMQEAIDKMLANSPVSGAKEWAIEDCEDFGDLEIATNESLDAIREKGQFVEEYGELGAALADHYGNLEAAKEALTSSYQGEYKSKRDFAIKLFGDLSQLPDNLSVYINYDLFCSDIFISDYFDLTLHGKVHIFSNH